MSDTIDSIKINGLTKPQLAQLMSYIEHFNDDTNTGWSYYGKRHHWDKRHDAIVDKIVPQLERICWNPFVRISRRKSTSKLEEQGE